MVISIDEKNFKKEILESKTLVIADFWAPWCGPCQMMGPLFEKISKDFSGKLKFVKINTDENPEISSKFDIQGIPCLIIMDKGKEVDRIVGFKSEDSLKREIENILER